MPTSYAGRMAYDERLASRVRQVLAREGAFEEKAMFGGLAFLLGGRMCCGILAERLMVRVDPDTYDAVLQETHASPMDFTGRQMRGFVFVHRDGVATAPALRKWIARAVAYVATQPPKVARRRPTPRRPKERARTPKLRAPAAAAPSRRDRARPR